MRSIKFLAVMAMVLFTSANTSAQKKRFEGEIIYSTSVTLNKTARKFIKGAEGEYKVKAVCKNGNEKTQENYYGSISYLFRDQDMCYLYSPKTKTGYKCTYSATVADNQKVRKVEDSTVKPTGETKEAFGLTFEHYKGEDVAKLDLLGTTLKSTDYIEYWVCRDYDESWIMSIMIPGFFESFDLRTSMKIPLMGAYEQHVEMNVEEFTPREVKDEEFDLPKDIIFEEVETSAQMESRLKSDYKKYKKALGEEKGEDVKQEGAAKVKGEWDF